MEDFNQQGLNDTFLKVRGFHKVMGHPAPDVPTPQTLDRRNKRGDWVVEEVMELQVAETIKDQADAYLDIIYFAVGGLVELGVIPNTLFNIVNAANMAKVWPDGTVHRREEDGKIMKPPGWQAPEPQLEAEIERQIRETPLAFPPPAV